MMRPNTVLVQLVAVALWALGNALAGGCDRRPSALPAKGPVKPEQLASLIDRADKVVVLHDPMSDEVLYESTSRQDLDALKHAMRVSVPEKRGRCKCLGSPAIDLYLNDQRIGRFTSHHGKKLRCEWWESDAPLVDVQALLTWLDQRNVPGPGAERNDAIEK